MIKIYIIIIFIFLLLLNAQTYTISENLESKISLSELIPEFAIPKDIMVKIEDNVKNGVYLFETYNLKINLKKGLYTDGKKTLRLEQFRTAYLDLGKTLYTALVFSIKEKDRNFYELTVLIKPETENPIQTNSLIIEAEKMEDLHAFSASKFKPPFCKDKGSFYPGCMGYCYSIPYISIRVLIDAKEAKSKEICVDFEKGSYQTIRVNDCKVSSIICDK